MKNMNDNSNVDKSNFNKKNRSYSSNSSRSSIKRHLLIAIVNYKHSETFESRINRLKETLFAMQKNIEEHNRTQINFFYSNIKGILLAPEYYLSRAVKNKIISDDEKQCYEKQIVMLSMKYPNILIIPGTIASEYFLNTGFYKEISELSGDQKSQIKEKYTKCYDSRGILQQNTNKLNQLDCNPAYRKNKLEMHFKQLQNKNDENFKKRYYAHPFVKNRQIEESSIDVYKKFPFENHTKKMTKNSVYIYLNGERLHKYKKTRHFKEEDNRDEQFFVPGDPIKSKFTFNVIDHYQIKPITMGIEVCFDHNQGMGKSTWQEGVDLQIIMSDAVPSSLDNFKIKDGGYVIHASTNGKYAGCWGKEVSFDERVNNLKLVLEEWCKEKPIDFKVLSKAIEIYMNYNTINKMSNDTETIIDDFINFIDEFMEKDALPMITVEQLKTAWDSSRQLKKLYENKKNFIQPLKVASDVHYYFIKL